MSRTSQKLKATDPSPRAMIGLDEAEQGSVSGAWKFIAFMRQETARLGSFSALPTPVRSEFLIIRDQLQKTEDFMRGYCARSIEDGRDV